MNYQSAKIGYVNWVGARQYVVLPLGVTHCDAFFIVTFLSELFVLPSALRHFHRWAMFLNCTMSTPVTSRPVLGQFLAFKSNPDSPHQFWAKVVSTWSNHLLHSISRRLVVPERSRRWYLSTISYRALWILSVPSCSFWFPASPNAWI